MADPREAIDVVAARFGTHPRTRALHAKGTWATGTFTATPEAAALCRAPHLQGDAVPVLVRLSNGGGDPTVPDYAPDVRGLAVSFELPDGTRTDSVTQSIPRFFSPTPDAFLDFLRANTGRAAALKLPLFLATHPRAARSLPVNAPALRPPESFARCRFYGVHAFRWTAADGSTRHVRTDWRPEAGEARLSPGAAKRRGRDYLREDLAARLAGDGTVTWVLDAQIAAEGDVVDDPSVHWPDDRRRVDVGRLVLDAVADDPEADGAIVVFDPSRVTDGIEMTADPVLQFRPPAYSESVRRRSG